MKKINSFIVLLFSLQIIYAFEMVDIPEITFFRPLKNGKQQEVTVSSFYMSKDDVLIEEWCEYKDATGIGREEHITPSDEYINMLKKDLEDYYGGAIDEGYVELYEDYYMPEINLKWPVNCITWLEAIEYCNWVSKKENLEICYTISKRADGTKTVKWNEKANGYRLPTVAEWEAVSEIYTGKITEDYIYKTNINIYSGSITNRPFSNKYEPNTYGLVNLICDIGKFLWDYYNENYEDNSLKLLNPHGAEDFEKPNNNKYKNELINEFRRCTVPCDIHTLREIVNGKNLIFCETSDIYTANTIRLCRNKE